MKILYLSRQYLYRDIVAKGLKEAGYQVDVYEDAKVVDGIDKYDAVYVEAMDSNILEAINRNAKKLILFTRGVEVYESSWHKLKWDKIDRLVFLSQHPADYFKIRYGNLYKSEAISVLPLPCSCEYF